jgi:hypothetical protein
VGAFLLNGQTDKDGLPHAMVSQFFLEWVTQQQVPTVARELFAEDRQRLQIVDGIFFDVLA